MVKVTAEPQDPSGRSASPADAVTRPLLLYDGGCRFCRWAARVVERLDRAGRLGFLSIRHPDAGPLLDGATDTDPLASWSLVFPNGSRLSGGPGVVALLERLSLLRWIGRMARALRLAPVLGVVDRWVARYKGRLSRRVPDGPGPHRFP